MSKTLIFVRHAHRNKVMGGSTDNGLSNKGEHQAQLILNHYKALYKDLKPEIVSSPKRRCVETVTPLAQEMDCSLKILSILDEGKASIANIEKFLNWWKKEASDLVIACSHGNWIPIFIEAMTGKSLELSKGGWIEFRLENGEVHFCSLIQDFDSN